MNTKQGVHTFSSAAVVFVCTLIFSFQTKAESLLRCYKPSNSSDQITQCLREVMTEKVDGEAIAAMPPQEFADEAIKDIIRNQYPADLELYKFTKLALGETEGHRELCGVLVKYDGSESIRFIKPFDMRTISFIGLLIDFNKPRNDSEIIEAKWFKRWWNKACSSAVPVVN
jgi:hypothetical protein